MFIRQELSEDQVNKFKEKLRALSDLADMVGDYNVAMSLIATMTNEEIYEYCKAKRVLQNQITYGITQL
jgi:mannitol/fructose-specific phosphotransferase system IIA component (Ntr-type)